MVDVSNESAGPPNIRAFTVHEAAGYLLEFVPRISLAADRNRGKALLELVHYRNKYGYITGPRNMLNCGRGYE